jgi:predicted MFS family arabinose efflux permease
VSKLAVSESQSISLLLILNGSGIPGRIFPNYISDTWLGPLNTMIPFALTSALMLYTWIAVTSVPGIIAFAVFYGTFSSGLLSLFPAVLASLTPDLNKTGVRLGMIMSCISFACLTGPPIGGALIQRQHGSYVGAQAFFGSLIALGFCFLIAVRYVRTGVKIAVRV